MISKQKGFNLLEVLISFLLIGVGALGLTKLNVYLEQESDYAIESIEALRLA
ncbi:type IV pilin, partial [Vibrio parahaemolyticus]